MMKQLILDIHPDAPPTLDNFVAGSNLQLLDTLENLPHTTTHLYLWGEQMCGRTHLLQAAVRHCKAAQRAAQYLSASEVSGAIDALPDTPNLLLAIDDVDQLSDAAQISLFNAFNRARSNQQTLLLSGPCPPRALALREDLRTRIGQCLIFEVQPLDDTARARILTTLAERRGLALTDELIQFVLRHGQRDLPSLVNLVTRLDRTSLEHQRPITLPLLRSLLHSPD